MRKWMTDKLFLYHWVRISILLFIYDIIVMNVSYGLALWPDLISGFLIYRMTISLRG